MAGSPEAPGSSLEASPLHTHQVMPGNALVHKDVAAGDCQLLQTLIFGVTSPDQTMFSVTDLFRHIGKSLLPAQRQLTCFFDQPMFSGNFVQNALTQLFFEIEELPYYIGYAAFEVIVSSGEALIARNIP